jgi:hypothetical protein
MPENINTARIEPLASSAERDAEYAPRAKKAKLKVAVERTATPAVEGELEEGHQLDERA